MSLGLTYEDLRALGPCADSLARVTKLMGGAKKWGNKKITAVQARKAGVTFDDIVWVASAKAEIDGNVKQRLRLWLADCAAHVLHIYAKDYSSDNRLREAILAARQFARGEIGDAARVAARAAARAAAGDAAWVAVWAAAGDAAGVAAGVAAGAAARVAAGDAVWVAAWDAVWAAAWDAEQNWQFDRLVLWLSEKEPKDWPLPTI